MAATSTRAPDDATRSFETTLGRLTYPQLCEQLAAPLQAIDLAIRRGDHGERALDEALLLDLHAALGRQLFPDQAGRYRSTQVQIGAHEPPAPVLVPLRMRDYVANLAARITHTSGEPDELLLELLAYAEGELLSIHPFPDLNGRISRLWLTEILRRLGLPPVDVVPSDPAFRQRYLAALAAADGRDWMPLRQLWRERLTQTAVLNEIVLSGCMPTPLASYLKALAVLRLVGEDADPGAAGCWRDDVFVLHTRLTSEQLTDFFLRRYRPTPLIAPWNGGSGFFAGDNQRGIAALAASQAERYASYRDAIALGRAAVQASGLAESPKDADKAALLQALRNQASDALLTWMDAAVILSGTDPRYPPLLGTGGNDGRLDFTNNFMQRLADVFDIASGEPAPQSADSLRSALFGSADTGQAMSAIGQFAPGSAGGPNAGTGFDAESRVNPWDYLLMLEGALLFAASTVRRLESADAAILTAPFTVRSRLVASGGTDGADNTTARGEIWMPLWHRPSSLPELRALLAEGRTAVETAVQTRPSRDGLDFARAVAQLGVDRGIGAFQRYAFMMRSGKAFLATPLQRVVVQRNPDADLIAQLEHNQWLAKVQRHARDDNAPHAFRSAARQLDVALFALAQRGSRDAVQAVLRQIGRIDSALHASAKSREAVTSPAPQLSDRWASAADDGSAEFAIAAALAGLVLRDAQGWPAVHVRRQLVGVGETINRDGDRRWEPASRLPTWQPGLLTANIAAMLQRRRLESVRLGCESELLHGDVGASAGDVACLLADSADERRIADLLAGLACVDLKRWRLPSPATASTELPPAFAVLKALFTPLSMLHTLRWLPDDRSLVLPAEIPARLAAGDVPAAVDLAWRRLRSSGIALPGRDPPQAVARDGLRWLAALCVPLSMPETARLLRSFDLAPPSPGVLR